ncbi:MAG: CoA transferase [Pseudomonadales bacterium]
MQQALEGLRVLDLTTGPAAGIATMILADFGAEVLLVVRPDDDPLARLPAAPLWRRGKRTTPLNLDSGADLDAFHTLCAGADVLVCNWRAAALASAGLDYESLHERHPHLVCCHLSGFGSVGPLAGCPAYEHLVAAATGRMNLFSGIVERRGPVFSALQVGVHASAQTAAASILAAVHARHADGAGRLVETSLLQGFLPYEQGAMLGAQFSEQLGEAAGALQSRVEEAPLPSLYYHPAQAGDGRWMQFGNLLPHLFENFLIVTELIDVVADPDFDPAQLKLPPEKQEAFRARMLERIQSRSSADWMTDFIDNGGVAATVYQTTQDALNDPDIVANGHVVARQDGGVQLGPVARLTTTPARPGPDARPDDGMASRWRDDPRPAPSRAKAAGLPLAGIRVVEIATIIAAPLGASFLADIGAEVIKVEQIGGDPYRGLGAGIGAARVNAGKQSVSVDLKSPAGRKLVLELIAGADVLIHNYRPGVPERLGIGYDQVREVNPDIVYLQCNGYGPDGPGAQRPSTHPIPGAAMGGVLYQLGERVPQALQATPDHVLWTRRLMRANEVNPDPNTALVVTTSVMLALVARQRTGQGQRVLVDMFGANAYANHDDFLRYPGKPPRSLPDEGLYGLHATYRLYRCAGEQWVFLALTTAWERQRFVAALTAAGITPPAEAVLAENDAATAEALSRLFESRDADAWEQLLGHRGIGCVRADRYLPSEYWLKDEQAKSLGATTPAEHPAWGSYRRHGPMARFDRFEPVLAGPPLAGQHNEALLTARGYTPEEIAGLYEARVLYRQT